MTPHTHDRDRAIGLCRGTVLLAMLTAGLATTAVRAQVAGTGVPGAGVPGLSATGASTGFTIRPSLSSDAVRLGQLRGTAYRPSNALANTFGINRGSPAQYTGSAGGFYSIGSSVGAVTSSVGSGPVSQYSLGLGGAAGVGIPGALGLEYSRARDFANVLRPTPGGAGTGLFEIPSGQSLLRRLPATTTPSAAGLTLDALNAPLGSPTAKAATAVDPFAAAEIRNTISPDPMRLVQPGSALRPMAPPQAPRFGPGTKGWSLDALPDPTAPPKPENPQENIILGRNVPAAPEDFVPVRYPASKYTLDELLETRMEDRYETVMARAREAFENQDYVAAQSHLRLAIEVAPPDDLTPQIMMMVSTVGAGGYAQGGLILAQTIRSAVRRNVSVLDTDFDPKTLYSDTALFVDQMRELRFYVVAKSKFKDVQAAALLSYLLWLVGERWEALSVMERTAVQPYANPEYVLLARQMRERAGVGGPAAQR